MLAFLLLIKLGYFCFKFFYAYWNIITPLPLYGHVLDLPSQLGAAFVAPIVNALPPEIVFFKGVLTSAHALLHLFLPFMAFFHDLGVIRDTLFSIRNVYPDTYQMVFGWVDFIIFPVLSSTDGMLEIASSGRELMIEVLYAVSQLLTRYLTPVLHICTFVVHAIFPIL